MSIIKNEKNIVLIEGILFIILGLLAIIAPIASTLATVLFLGWLLVIAGCIQAYRTFKGKEAAGTGTGTGFYWSLLSAILNIGLGLIFIFAPGIGVMTLTMLLIVFFLLQGFFKIALALEARHSPNWIWLLVSGFLSVFLAGIIFSGWPGTATWVIGLLVGINMFFFGAALVALSMTMSKIDKQDLK